MNVLLSTCAAAVLAASGAADSTPQAYEITLHRPAEVGDRMSIVAEGAEERGVTAIIDGNAQRLDHSAITIEFTADAKVLDVDEQGRATKVEYTLMRCLMTINGTADTLGPAGTRIIAFRNGDGNATRYSINGKLLGTNQMAALSLVIPLDVTGPTDDDVFGTSDQQRVGDQWPLNREMALEAFAGSTNLPVSGSDVSGYSTLLSARDFEKEPCLMISSRITVENFLPGFDEMPRGFELKRAFVTAMHQGLFPLDDDKPVMQDSLNMDLDAVMIGALGPDQPAAVLQLRGTRTASRRYTVVEPSEKVAASRER